MKKPSRALYQLISKTRAYKQKVAAGKNALKNPPPPSNQKSIVRPGDKVQKVPVGGMMTADWNPGRVRQFVDATGKVVREKRG